VTDNAGAELLKLTHVAASFAAMRSLTTGMIRALYGYLGHKAACSPLHGSVSRSFGGRCVVADAQSARVRRWLWSRASTAHTHLLWAFVFEKAGL